MERRGLLITTEPNLPRLANEKVKSIRGTRHLLRVNPKRPSDDDLVTLSTKRRPGFSTRSVTNGVDSSGFQQRLLAD